jgi:hypothetical protein
MIVAILALVIAMGLGVGAWTAAGGDIHIGGYSHEQERAYAAAEAGAQWYQAQLTQDPTYWSVCDQVPIPNGETSMPVNQKYDNTTPRKWRTFTSNGDQFTIELLPPPGQSGPCVPGAGNEGTIIDPSTRSFRIRVTGRSRSGPASCDAQGQVTGCPVKRSIIATFRRSSFLDFLYFSDLETPTPAVNNFVMVGANQTSTPDFESWASSNCNQYYWQGRSANTVDVTLGVSTKTITCNQPQFNGPQGGNAGDRVDGPMHTNDSIVICNTMPFGRNKADAIEIANGNPDAATLPGGGSPTGYASVNTCGAGGTPQWNGTQNLVAPYMQMPTANSALAGTAFNKTGRLDVELNGTQFRWRNKSTGAFSAYQNIPPSGIIYANNGAGCTTGYSPEAPYVAATSDDCGDVFVSGHYSTSVTIGAQNDIVIDNSTAIPNIWGVTRDNNSMLGLIANNNVRIYRPVATANGNPSTWTPNNFGASPSNPARCNTNVWAPHDYTVDAAILALNGSFIADNWTCPPAASVNTLTVRGVIAQKYRGPVGTSSAGVPQSGFVKSYTYDDRFHTGSPPKFLDPVQSAWTVARITEQVPAT